MSLTNNTTLKNMNYNGEKVKKWIHNGVQVFSAGSTVTYVVDSGVSYTEEVDSGASCLSPTTFTPSKDGWTFVGWREDTTASGSVLSSKVMESEPITLYAVYAKTITANFYSGWYPDTRVLNTPTGIAYYNAAGNIQNAQITAPTGTGISGWTWRGWSNWYDGTANGDVNLNNGDIFYVHPDNDGITLLGLYQQTITEKFIDYDGSKNNEYPQYATTYYNSAGNTSYSNITVPNAAEWSGMAFQGWSYPNSNSFDVNVTAGQVLQSTADCTRYAIYAKTVYLYYDGNGASSGSVTTQSGTVWCNVVGNWSYPSFTLASNGFSRTYYDFANWSVNGSTYAAGASVTLTASATAYANWQLGQYVVYDSGSSAVAFTVSKGPFTTVEYTTTPTLKLHAQCSDGSSSDNARLTSANVDCSLFSTLHFRVTKAYVNGWGKVGVYANGDVMLTGNTTSFNQTYDDYTVDVSSLSTVVIGLVASAGQGDDQYGEIIASKIWLT